MMMPAAAAGSSKLVAELTMPWPDQRWQAVTAAVSHYPATTINLQVSCLSASTVNFTGRAS
jgi:hypothetical protein